MRISDWSSDVCSSDLLDSPSAVSVGLCLGRVCSDKSVWIDALGLGADVRWPMAGKPRALYVDNAAEFKSEALRRGCEQHGIDLGYRPPGRPHYGGIRTEERRVGKEDGSTVRSEWWATHFNKKTNTDE